MPIVALPKNESRAPSLAANRSVLVDDSLLFVSRLREEAYEYGFRLGRESASQEREPALVAVISEYAETLSRPYLRGPFESAGRDSERQAQYERDVRSREEAEIRSGLARQELAAKDRDIAEVEGKRIKAPAKLWIAYLLAGVAAALSILVGIYDFLVDHTAEAYTAPLAVLGSFVLGYFYTYVALWPFRSGKRSFMSHIPLIVGFLICTAFSAIRIHNMPVTKYGWWLPYAVFAIEFAVLLAIECIAISHSKHQAEYQTFENSLHAAKECKRVVEDVYRDRVRDAAEIDSRVQAFIRFRDECNVLADRRDDIIASVRTAGVAGYETAIQQNRGAARRV
jgi:hypothetical protein